MTVRTGLLAVVVMLGWGMPALAQTPELPEVDSEYRTFFLAHRAVSSCPGLVEDWEHELIGSWLESKVPSLTGGGVIAPEVKRQMIGQVEALGCDDPAVMHDAGRLRHAAHRLWRLAADAWQSAEGCTPPDEEQQAFFGALRGRIDKAHSGENGLPPLDAARLADAVPGYSALLSEACAANAGAPGFDTEADRLQIWAKMPYWDYLTLTSNGSRDRDFDVNSGYTPGVGETAGLDRPRITSVVGQRASRRDYRAVRMRNLVACGGKPAQPVRLEYFDPIVEADVTQMFDDLIECSVTIEADGTAWVDVEWQTDNLVLLGQEAVNVRLAGVALQIVTMDGALVSSLPGIVSYEFPLGAEGEIPQVMQPILEQAGTTHQVHIKLTFEIAAGGTLHRVDDIVHGFGIPGISTVAAADVIRAARFAFGDQSDDLIWDGLVGQAAKQAGLGDNLTLTFDQ